MENKDVRAVNLLFLFEVTMIILGFTVLVMLLGLVCIPFQGMGIDPEKIVQGFIELVSSNQILAMVISQGLIAFPFIIFIINKKKLVKSNIRFNKISIKTLVYIIVFTYIMTPVMTFINMLSMLFVDNKVATTIDNIVDNQSIIVAVICVALLPAFVEEILCRGIIYNIHAKVSKRKAVIMSGLLFGLLHCNFNQFAYAFFMGCVFALVVEATDSVISTVMMHFIFNANSLVIAYLAEYMGQKISFEESGNFTIYEVMCWGSFALVAFIVAIFVYKDMAKINGRLDYIKKEILCINYRRKANRDDNKNDSELNSDYTNKNHSNMVIDVYLIAAMIMCLIYMIYIEAM